MPTLKGVAGLRDKPEALHPARHGHLWRVSKLLRLWEQRWFCLDEQGFVYSKSPQGIALAKPVFSNRALVKKAVPEEQVATKVNMVMWGLSVTAEDNTRVTLYSEDRLLRDTWVRTINMVALARREAQLLSDRFDVDWASPLGSGLFAVVFKAESKDGQPPVAVKIIKADAYREYQDLIQREIMVWHAVGIHPHVVRLHEVLYSQYRVYFIAELAAGGNLVESLAQRPQYTEADVARVMRQLLEAVRHFHSQGLVHMDLKPENIVLADRSHDSPIKLIDFSLASFFHTSTEPGGTPEFVAPELLNDPEKYADEGCGPAIDIWAVGIILFYLISGRTPFQAETMQEIIELVKRGMWTFTPTSTWATISPEAKDLVSRMLQLDPASRPSAAQLLCHPWIQAKDHLPLPLAAAQHEFKVMVRGIQPNSVAMRTSWIRRTGVLRHAENGNVVLGGISSSPGMHQSGMAAGSGGDGSGAAFVDGPSSPSLFAQPASVPASSLHLSKSASVATTLDARADAATLPPFQPAPASPVLAPYQPAPTSPALPPPPPSPLHISFTGGCSGVSLVQALPTAPPAAATTAAAAVALSYLQQGGESGGGVAKASARAKSYGGNLQASAISEDQPAVLHEHMSLMGNQAGFAAGTQTLGFMGLGSARSGGLMQQHLPFAPVRARGVGQWLPSHLSSGAGTLGLPLVGAAGGQGGGKRPSGLSSSGDLMQLGGNAKARWSIGTGTLGDAPTHGASATQLQPLQQQLFSLGPVRASSSALDSSSALLLNNGMQGGASLEAWNGSLPQQPLYHTHRSSQTSGQWSTGGLVDMWQSSVPSLFCASAAAGRPSMTSLLSAGTIPAGNPLQQAQQQLMLLQLQQRQQGGAVGRRMSQVVQGVAQQQQEVMMMQQVAGRRRSQMVPTTTQQTMMAAVLEGQPGTLTTQQQQQQQLLLLGAGAVDGPAALGLPGGQELSLEPSRGQQLAALQAQLAYLLKAKSEREAAAAGRTLAPTRA